MPEDPLPINFNYKAIEYIPSNSQNESHLSTHAGKGSQSISHVTNYFPFLKVTMSTQATLGSCSR